MENCYFQTGLSAKVYTLKAYKAVRIDFFFYILKVANIRRFILIKCSEQKARLKDML
jgi:hypothetical protein